MAFHDRLIMLTLKKALEAHARLIRVGNPSLIWHGRVRKKELPTGFQGKTFENVRNYRFPVGSWEIYIYMAMYILLSYPKPHPFLWKNRVRGGSVSLWQNKVFSDVCDFPCENIGFDTPSLEGGALMCFITKEQHGKRQLFRDLWRCAMNVKASVKSCK